MGSSFCQALQTCRVADALYVSDVGTFPTTEG
jgi:hypothetical protein